MTISLSDAGKRFNREWIFRHVTLQFEEGGHYAITGPNGSGKSTLLQVIAGATATSEGNLIWQPTPQRDSLPLEADKVFQQLSIAAPYLDLIEEMTITELLEFHSQFKPLLPAWSAKDIVGKVGLEKAAHKQIRYYSSGMKQRAKLAQAIFSDVKVILLDEPCTNLDATGIALYQQLIHEFGGNRTIIVSSNDEQEYGFCQQQINIMDYKTP